MLKIINDINKFVWGIPTLLMIGAVGIYFAIRTRLYQIRILPAALRYFIKQFRQKNDDGISSYRAVCTALAATVGTGNLAGVAGAITLGGPGAIFWMWICAFLGMGIKFAEATLAVRFRKKHIDGSWFGGPMYMIENGLGHKWRWLAVTYSFFGAVAAFGVGNATQINTVVNSIDQALVNMGISPSMILNASVGVFFAVVLSIMLLGGAKSVGHAAEILIPFASIIYLGLAGCVLILHYQQIPRVLTTILRCAFSTKAISGGILGSMFVSIRVGAARGIFSNEAGMGTAAIAHAGANVNHPVEQGHMGIVEVFLDTIVICTLTGLVILCSGVHIPYGTDPGVILTANSFSSTLGSWVLWPLTLALCLFATGTYLGWGLYGLRCVEYLLGPKAWIPFVVIQGIVVVISAVSRTGTVWLLSEIVNGLMAIPNLLALLLLSPHVFKLIREYKGSARN